MRTGDSAVFRPAPTLALRDGRWQITVPMGDLSATARAGDPLHFPHRSQRADQDWLRFPVTGINLADAEAYLEWLDRSQKVPGARLCSELEWERAARGADGRKYPTGESIDKRDANFDETYGRDFAAMGPDEVGSHPASASPFGVQDTMGNVWEWVTPSVTSGESVVRGGAFHFDKITGSPANRNVVAPGFRDGTLGLRVCATPRPPI
jgi:formylglycine-generating enzyme required for sulfatase activity